MKTNKKIMLLIDNLGSGGAQRQIVLLTTELSKLGLEVTLVTYNKNEHMAYMLEGLNVKRVNVNTEGQTKIIKLYTVVRYLLNAKPKIIISYLDNPNLMAGFYALLSKKVIWIPSERNLNTGSGFQVFWRKILYNFATKVVSNSYVQQGWLLKNKILPLSKAIVIWNGIFEDFWNVNNIEVSKSIDFISLGRLTHQKNPELLLDAIRLISKQVDYCFSWYGDDDPVSPYKRDTLLQVVNDEGLPISFYTANKEPHVLLSKAKCLILTSRYEGTPNVVLEAMASGVFVIAPDIVDLPIILGNNERGILFQQGNPTSLANAILKYINLADGDKIAVIRNANNYAQKNFMSKNFALKYMELIDNG